jgi:hypothetical protein
MGKRYKREVAMMFRGTVEMHVAFDGVATIEVDGEDVISMIRDFIIENEMTRKSDRYNGFVYSIDEDVELEFRVT